jgi:hypothetical protein
MRPATPSGGAGSLEELRLGDTGDHPDRPRDFRNRDCRWHPDRTLTFVPPKTESKPWMFSSSRMSQWSTAAFPSNALPWCCKVAEHSRPTGRESMRPWRRPPSIPTGSPACRLGRSTGPLSLAIPRILAVSWRSVPRFGEGRYRTRGLGVGGRSSSLLHRAPGGAMAAPARNDRGDQLLRYARPQAYAGAFSRFRLVQRASAPAPLTSGPVTSSNTPLQWVVDSEPRRDTLAFQVDPMPTSIVLCGCRNMTHSSTRRRMFASFAFQ